MKLICFWTTFVLPLSFNNIIRCNIHHLIRVWEAAGAVVTGRVMLGATKPSDSAPGTIRGDFAIGNSF